jgi:hypothetical protein
MCLSLSACGNSILAVSLRYRPRIHYYYKAMRSNNSKGFVCFEKYLENPKNRLRKTIQKVARNIARDHGKAQS